MNPRTRSALLWGLVGALAFLVLLQGYALVVDPLVSIGGAVAVALVVGAATAASAYALESRLAAWAARRSGDETDSRGGDGKSKS